MGQLKLILPADKSGGSRRLEERRKVHHLSAAELAVVQRFAPPTPARGESQGETQKTAATGLPPLAERSPAPPPPGSTPTVVPLAPPAFAFTRGMRLLIGGLLAAALIPNLILGVVFLFGGGSSAPSAKPETTVPAVETASHLAVLTTPPILEASAGDEVPFPIALDGTDGVPARSIIAISGLPHGASFSDGRPYGETEWNLRSDQIGDLRLILPDTANGELRLAIKLIAPDETVVADAATTLKIAPAASAQAEATAPADAALAAIQDDVGVEERITPQEATAGPTTDAATTDAAIASGEDVAEPQPDNADQVASAQTESDESPANTVRPAAFVNLRDGPSSSSRIIAVVAKGAKLSLTERKRGWLHVTLPATSKDGWIYSGYVEGAKKSRPRMKRTARTEAAQKPASSLSSSSSSSFWSNVGRWLGGTSAGSSANGPN